MSEGTIVGGRRGTQRGHVWPAAGPREPCASPIAPCLPRSLPMVVPTAPDACDGNPPRTRPEGGAGVQSP